MDVASNRQAPNPDLLVVNVLRKTTVRKVNVPDGFSNFGLQQTVLTLP